MTEKKQYGGDHYLRMNVQPWDIIEHWPHVEQAAYYRGNLIKYAMRANAKDTPLLNAQKALHYAQKWVEVEEERVRSAADQAETFADASEAFADPNGCEHYLPQKVA